MCLLWRSGTVRIIFLIFMCWFVCCCLSLIRVTSSKRATGLACCAKESNSDTFAFTATLLDTEAGAVSTTVAGALAKTPP